MVLLDKISARSRQEQQMIAAGEAPRPRIKNPVQRTALRFLAMFFALMLTFTVVARAADGMTIALVSTDKAKSGVLTDRVLISGQITPSDDISIELPDGLKLDSIPVKAGQRVKAGDPLLQLNLPELEQACEALQKEIEILELRIDAASKGVSGVDTESVLAAQSALEDARADYDRLVDRLARSDARTADNLTELENELRQAQLDFEKTVQKTRDALVKAAEKAVDSARDALSAAEDAAEDAIAAAQQAYDQALENESSADDAYYNARDAVRRAQSKLDSARGELDELLEEQPPDPDAIAAAQEYLELAQAEFDQAVETLNKLPSGGNSSSSYARDSLDKAKRRSAESVDKAETALAEAKAELADIRVRSDFSDEVQVISAQSQVDSAERALKTARLGQEDEGYSNEDQLRAAMRAIEAAERSLESAEKQMYKAGQDDAISRAQAEIDRLTYQNDRQKLEKQLETLMSAMNNGGAITAPLDGTVLSVPEKGAKTASETLTLSRDDQGFTFEGTIDSKSAQKLAAGDTGSLNYTHDGKSTYVQAKIISIGIADETGNVPITAELPSGSYPSGAGGELDITQRSEMHHSCLPLSALRSGANGDYVLVLREKKSVLGTEWTVASVPVTVKDRDSELMSVESTLMWDDQVIISANKPLSEGDRVRLE